MESDVLDTGILKRFFAANRRTIARLLLLFSGFL